MWTDRGLRPPTAPVLARGSDTRPAEVLAVGTNNGGGAWGIASLFLLLFEKSKTKLFRNKVY